MQPLEHFIVNPVEAAEQGGGERQLNPAKTRRQGMADGKRQQQVLGDMNAFDGDLRIGDGQGDDAERNSRQGGRQGQGNEARGSSGENKYHHEENRR